jgi:phosphomannomutase
MERSAAAEVDPAIFKAYDVRGIHPDQIDAGVAYRIGRAFARVLGELEDKPPSDLRVALARDMRLAAPELVARYAEGIADEGADVLDIGMAATEMLYYAVGSRKLDGGLACTASHNPKAYTGAKLVRSGALPLSGDAGIGELRDLVAQGDPGPPVQPRGEIRREDVADGFRAHVLGFVDPDRIRELAVVLDGGNGMAGPMVGPILDSFPLDQVRTYWDPDGEFPDHEPNPLLPENRRFVIDKVISEGADLGIAWDGDADRCFFIDDGGEFVDGDFLTALLAESILQKEPGAAILYDVRASRAVRDVVEGAGGTALVNRVGHAFFKARMRETGAAFGGEVSGHYYFRDFFCADSGTVPALLMLELLSLKEGSLSELLAPLRERYFISGEINSEVTDQEGKMRELADRYSDGEVSWLDGVSVDHEDWHFNVRPSNTEPLLRLNLESLVSREDMERRRDEVLALIRA